MGNQNIVRDWVEISAPVEKVWKVLTDVELYKQWDDLPDTFSETELQQGTVIEWEGFARMTVSVCEEHRELKMSLFLPNVPLQPAEYDIAYGYSLQKQGDKTLLTFDIGDFSPLPDAQSYRGRTVEFVKTAKERIKILSEQIGTTENRKAG